MLDCQETYTQPPHGDLPTKWARSNLFTGSRDFYLISVLTFYTSQVVTETGLFLKRKPSDVMTAVSIMVNFVRSRQILIFRYKMIAADVMIFL